MSNEDLEEEEEEEDSRIKPEPPLATCCENGRRLIVLVSARLFDNDFVDTAAFVAWQRANPPKWHLARRRLRLIGDNYESDLSREIEQIFPLPIKFCPFCSAPVPQIEWNPAPIRSMCVILDGGYYCATCEQRLIGCYCAPFEHLWRVAES